MLSYLKSIFFLAILFSPSIILAINADSLKAIINQQQGIEKATSLNLLGASLRSGAPNEGLIYIKEAYKLAKDIDYKNEISAISGFVELFMAVRKYDSSAFYVEIGLNLSREKQDTVNLMGFLTNIGWTYYYQGEYKQAQSSFSEAMHLFETYVTDHPDNNEIDVLNYAKLLNNKAIIYTRMGYYDSAMILFTESLEYREKHNAGPEYIAPTLINFGAVCYKNEKYTLAIEHFTNALKLYEKLDDSSKIASCYSNLT